MNRALGHAEVLARVGGLAGLYGIDLDAIYGALSELGAELSRRVLVTVPHTFDRIALTTRTRRERAATIVDVAQQQRLDQLAPEATDLEIELEAGGGFGACTVRALHARALVTLAPVLEAFGVMPLGLERLRLAGDRLGSAPYTIADRLDADGSRRWSVHYRHHNDEATRVETEQRLLDVARALAVTKAQTSIIEGLHGVLANGADSQALLSIGVGESVPAFALRWIHLGFDTVIRMMLGFYPELDAGKRLGELAGALAADRATAVELQFGATEPPAMRVAIAL